MLVGEILLLLILMWWPLSPRPAPHKLGLRLGLRLRGGSLLIDDFDLLTYTFFVDAFKHFGYEFGTHAAE